MKGLKYFTYILLYFSTKTFKKYSDYSFKLYYLLVYTVLLIEK